MGNKALEIIKSFPPPSAREEAVLNTVLDRLGRNRITAEEAVDKLVDTLDWPIERAAAEVDAFLE